MKAADLFEVAVPEFKHLKQCRKEVKMLKSLWDLTYLITSTFESWMTSKWTGGIGDNKTPYIRAKL